MYKLMITTNVRYSQIHTEYNAALTDTDTSCRKSLQRLKSCSDIDLFCPENFKLLSNTKYYLHICVITLKIVMASIYNK